jgi:hypothetical protein
MQSKHKRYCGNRTIRQGQVRLYGRTYAPDEQHMKYDGRLDGKRGNFYVYPMRENLAALHHIIGEPHAEIVDGHIPWYFWHETT